MNDSQPHLEYDWYAGSIPDNVDLGQDVYIDTTYSFAPFFSQQQPGLVLENGSGAYDRTAFVVGPAGKISVGAYTCLNATYLICNQQITIGAHCLLAWGVVLTDTWLNASTPLAIRRKVLEEAASSPSRCIPPVATPQPIVLEDNVWVGFDSVILPGSRLGEGCVVGCKTIVAADIPPYALVVGNPARIIRYLEPDESKEHRDLIIQEYLRG